MAPMDLEALKEGRTPREYQMSRGKLEAFFRDNVLVDQPFARESDKTVGELAEEASGKLGEKVVIRRFALFQLGEELE